MGAEGVAAVATKPAALVVLPAARVAMVPEWAGQLESMEMLVEE